MYTLYADGSCLGNPGPGGWAWLILNSGEEELATMAGGEDDTTNNRMELCGAISALTWLQQSALPAGEVEMKLDSQYVLKGLFEWRAGWEQKGMNKVKNPDLWADLFKVYDALTRLGWTFKSAWVKGHADDAFNNKVDAMAQEQSGRIKATKESAMPPTVVDDASVVDAVQPQLSDAEIALKTAKDMMVVARVDSMTPEIFLLTLRSIKHLL